MERTLETVVRILNEKGYPTTQDGVVTYLEKQYPMGPIITPLLDEKWEFTIEHIANEIVDTVVAAHEFYQLTNK